MYLWLLFLCWFEGSIPADVEALFPIFAGLTRAEFEGQWRRIAPCFIERDGRLIHPRLERERTKQAEWSEKSRSGGLKSAEARRKGGSASTEATGNIPVSGFRFPDSSLQKEKTLCAPTSGAQVDGDNFSLIEPNEKPEWFNVFWAKYSRWRNRDKKRAKAVFTRVVKSEAIFQAIMAGITAQGAEMMAREAAHRPHATTWLNGRRWEDSPEEAPALAGKREQSGGAVSRAMDLLYQEENSK